MSVRMPLPVTSVRDRFAALASDDRGLSTAEYAVGTCAVAGLGGLLVKLLTSDGMRDLIWSLITKAFGGLFGF
jgi:hypothetical protein